MQKHAACKRQPSPAHKIHNIYKSKPPSPPSPTTPPTPPTTLVIARPPIKTVIASSPHRGVSSFTSRLVLHRLASAREIQIHRHTTDTNGRRRQRHNQPAITSAPSFHSTSRCIDTTRVAYRHITSLRRLPVHRTSHTGATSLRHDCLPTYIVAALPTVRHVASPTILGGCFKVRVCVYCIFTFISTDDKLTTYRPSLVTPYYVVAYPHTNGRRTSRCIVRHLPNVTPTIPRITPLRAYRCIVFRRPSHAAILIIPTVVGSGLS